MSAYAIDDLLFQDALLDAVERAIAEIVEASRELFPVLVVGAPLRRDGRLFNCAVVIHRGDDARRRAEDLSAELSRVLRARGISPPAPASATPRSQVAGHEVAVRRRSAVPLDGLGAVHLPRRDLRGLLGAAAAIDAQRRWPAPRCCSTCRPATSPSARPRRGACCAPSSPRAASRPMPIRPRAPANRPPISPGTATPAIFENGEQLAETERFPRDSTMVGRRRRPRPLRQERMRVNTFGDCVREEPRPRPQQFRIVDLHARRARRRSSPLLRDGRALSVRAGRSGAAARELLRGLQHPGPGPGQTAAGDRDREGRHRRLRRPRFDAGADRVGARDGPARPAAHQRARLHAAGLRHLRRHQGQRLGADARARRQRRRRSTSARPRSRCWPISAIRSRAASRSTT